MSDPIPVLQFPSPNGLSESAASIGRSLNEAVETPRFCVDCKWIDQPDWKYPRCRAPLNFRSVTSLVTGQTTESFEVEYCDTQRTTGVPGRCGPSGLWFSPRDAQ